MTKRVLLLFAVVAIASFSLAPSPIIGGGSGGGTPGGLTTEVQYNSAGAFAGITFATTDGSTLTITNPKVITAVIDTNGNELFKVTATASAINELTIANAAASGRPAIIATGDDTNVGIQYTVKGSGIHNFTGAITSSAAITGTDIFAAGGNRFLWTSRSRMYSPSDGVIRIGNNAENDFNRLQFGGTTSSYPAIKRNTTALQVVLADDSALSFIEDLYRRSGSGSPEGAVTAPVGAIYHRTDGGDDTAAYLKTSGTGNTGWKAIENVP